MLGGIYVGWVEKGSKRRRGDSRTAPTIHCTYPRVAPAADRDDGGKPRVVHASNPPIRLAISRKPARRSKLVTMELR